MDSIDGRIFQPSGLVYMIINLRSASSVRTKYESRFCKKCVLSGAPQSKLLFNENKEKNHQLIGAAIKKNLTLFRTFFYRTYTVNDVSLGICLIKVRFLVENF